MCVCQRYGICLKTADRCPFFKRDLEDRCKINQNLTDEEIIHYEEVA